MTAAWFQLITSEKGSSHPLLSITGTQAACVEEESFVNVREAPGGAFPMGADITARSSTGVSAWASLQGS